MKPILRFPFLLIVAGCRVQAPVFSAEDVAGCFILVWQRRDGHFPGADFETPATMKLLPLAQPVGRGEPGTLGLRLEPFPWPPPASSLPGSAQTERWSGRQPHEWHWAGYYHRSGWHVEAPGAVAIELRGNFVGWSVRLAPAAAPTVSPSLNSLRGTGEFLERQRRGGWRAVGRADIVARRIACPSEEPARSAAG